MLSGRAFRAQLISQGQRELFDYWVRSAGARPMPARSDLDPLKVPRLLPHIGLIDVGDDVGRACFRLAGTRLREIYGQEITGKCVDQIFCGESAEYWQRVHRRVVEQGVPALGVIHGPALGRDHVVLFWLRLPLSEDGGRVDRILCHDMAGPTESPRAHHEHRLLRYRRPHPKSAPPARRVQFG